MKPALAQPKSDSGERLESWKEIAAFLGKGVRTVQRWERTEDLPVRRHLHERGGTVYGYKTEILEWYRSRQLRLDHEQVTEDVAPATTPPTPASVPQTRTRASLSILLSIVGAVALLVPAALLKYAPSRPFAGPNITLLSVVGRASQAVPSPDGHRVVFAWNGVHEAGNLDLYVKDVEGGAPERLTTDRNNEHSPSWSADGNRIAFLRDNEGVFIITTTQGAMPERIAQQKPGAVYGVGSSWSADRRFFYYSELSRGSPLEIFRLDMTTKAVERLTSPSEGQGDMYPALSPDGRHLAFVRQARSLAGSLYALQLASGNRNAQVLLRLTDKNSRIAGADWLPNGRGIVFSSDYSGGRRLWLLRRGWWGWQTDPQPLALLGEDAFQPRIAQPSSVLVYSRRYWPTAIWRLDLDEQGTAASAPVKIAASAREDMEPAWSPDGKRIAFISTRSGHTEVWTCAADGGDAIQLTFFRGPLTHSPSWSPDSKMIAFHAGPERSSSVFVVSATGGSTERITREGMHATQPAWSHDGKHLYFTSNLGGFDRIWSIRVDSGDLAPLTKPHSVLAQPSPDGDWIYFRRDGVWRISKRTGAEEQVIPGPVGTFSLAGDRIYFDRGFGDYATPEIYLYFLKIRQTRLVSRLEARKAAGISVLPGGHSLLLALHDRQSSEIILARDNGQDLRSEGL